MIDFASLPTSLPGLPAAGPKLVRLEPPVHAGVVRMLRGVLAEAEAGEIESIGIVAIYARGGTSGEGYAGEARFPLVAALESLKWRIFRDCEHINGGEY